MIQPIPTSAVPSIFSNEIFLRALFGPDWERVKVCLLAGDPGKQPRGAWKGYPAVDMLKVHHANLNAYFSVSVQSGTSRSLAGFETVRVIVLDDIGVKVDLKAAIDLLGNPTYLIETSPGNCQAGWATEIGSRDYALGLVRSLYRALGAGDNLKNLVGYMRLPIGANWKAKCGPYGFRHVVRAWDPSARIDPLGWLEVEKRIGKIVPIAKHLGQPDAAMPDPGEIEDDAVLRGFRMLGSVQGLGRSTPMGWGFDVECPWIEEHSERVHEGTAYVPVKERFHCHHGHCQDRTMGDVRERLTELLRKDCGTTLAALEFDDIELAGVIDPDADKTAVGRLLPTLQELAGYEKTEDGMGLAFRDRHRDQLQFDKRQKCWFYWTGAYWREDPVSYAYRWALALLREYRGAPPQDATAIFLKATGKTAFADAIERLGRAHLAVDGKGWDQDPYLVGAPGCEVDLRTGRVITPDPGHLITKQLLVAPDFDMPTPIWDQFLWDSTGGDPELIAFLQAWAGYNLTGDVSEEKFVFIYGEGGNGKGTFLYAINSILNDYYSQVSVEMFMMRKFDAHPEEIARLFGVRAVTASEIGVGKTWNTGRLKDFSGGDRLTGHLMRQNSITFYPQFKITFAGNNQPRLPEIDDAIRRRLILVPFTQKPKQLDPTLKGPNSRLVAEYPGILAWMIRGENRRSTAGGLDKLIPGIASQATATYLDEQDQIKNWAKERCVFGPRERVSVRQAYEDYKAWCYAQGGSPVNTSIHDFCTKFLVRFQNCTKRDYNDHRTPVGFEGVGLTPQDGGVAGVAGF